MKNFIMENSKKILKITAVSLLWLAIWQVIAITINQEILIPTPFKTFISLLELAKTPKFWFSVFWSMLRIIIGYLLGVVVGTIGGVLTAYSKIFKSLITPILHLIRAVPVASFIILSLVWLKSSNLPIFISFLMVLPMIWGNVENGLNNIDIKFLEMAKIFRIKPIKVFFNIKLPLILPSLISTSITALGFSWKSGVAAEVICRPINSIGGMLQDAKIYLETPNVFALTAVVAILSLLLETIIKRTLRRYTGDKA